MCEGRVSVCLNCTLRTLHVHATTYQAMQDGLLLLLHLPEVQLVQKLELVLE